MLLMAFGCEWSRHSSRGVGKIADGISSAHLGYSTLEEDDRSY